MPDLLVLGNLFYLCLLPFIVFPYPQVIWHNLRCRQQNWMLKGLRILDRWWTMTCWGHEWIISYVCLSSAAYDWMDVCPWVQEEARLVGQLCSAMLANLIGCCRERGECLFIAEFMSHTRPWQSISFSVCLVSPSLLFSYISCYYNLLAACLS
jgi:hypothetical protein